MRRASKRKNRNSTNGSIPSKFFIHKLQFNIVNKILTFNKGGWLRYTLCMLIKYSYLCLDVEYIYRKINNSLHLYFYQSTLDYFKGTVLSAGNPRTYQWANPTNHRVWCSQGSYLISILAYDEHQWVLELPALYKLPLILDKYHQLLASLSGSPQATRYELISKMLISEAFMQ